MLPEWRKWETFQRGGARRRFPLPTLRSKAVASLGAREAGSARAPSLDVRRWRLASRRSLEGVHFGADQLLSSPLANLRVLFSRLLRRVHYIRIIRCGSTSRRTRVPVCMHTRTQRQGSLVSQLDWDGTGRLRVLVNGDAGMRSNRMFPDCALPSIFF